MAKQQTKKTDLMLKDNPDRLSPGQRVAHAVFGEGTVLGTDNDSYIIRFDSLPTPRSLTVTAKLKKL